MSRMGMRGSDGLELTGVGGIARVGNALFRCTDFRSTFTQTFHKGRGELFDMPGSDLTIRAAARDDIEPNLRQNNLGYREVAVARMQRPCEANGR